ncbi:hypothetical protein K377_08213, partial [Streptomyces sp. PsTaAH-137]
MPHPTTAPARRRPEPGTRHAHPFPHVVFGPG